MIKLIQQKSGDLIHCTLPIFGIMNKETVILIPIPALFSFQECLWFLNRNYDDCLHIIDENSITKAIEFEGAIILIQITENGNHLEVSLLSGTPSVNLSDFLIGYVQKWFDMDNNIQPFYDQLLNDGSLSYMVNKFKGLRLIGIEDLFEAICWCIIGQQINLSFAYKLKRRLVESFGTSIRMDDKSYYIFPKPQVLASASVDELRAMQFSQQKATYLINIAKLFSEGQLSKAMLESLPDFQSRKKLLIQQKGIGEWTANYALMKSLKEPTCIPHGDVGLLNALLNHNFISDRSELHKIDALFARFAGWESYLVFYLWRSLAIKS